MFLLVLVGGILFYDWVLGQMNLEHLPLFETVEVTLGKELLERFGTSFDSEELAQIASLGEAVEKGLDEKVRAEQVFAEAGITDFRQLEKVMSYDDDTEPEKPEELEEAYYAFWEKYEWEIESLNYYFTLTEERDNRRSMLYAFHMNGLERKARERLEREMEQHEQSALPYAVVMNMRYVMESFARIVCYLVMFLVFPYLAADNRANVYPLTATTKRGRGFLKTRLTALLTGLLPLFAVCDAVLYLAYRWGTQYSVFRACRVEGLWFDLSWSQYFWAQVLLCNLLEMALGLLFFFAASFCRTLAGTVVMALPCWAAGEVVNLKFMHNLLSCQFYWGNAFGYCFRYGSFLVLGGLFLAGGLCLFGLFRYKGRADILT